MVQCLGLSNAGGMGLMPGPGTGIPHATLCGYIYIYMYIYIMFKKLFS